jgi:4-diphosphocytidyl-2-C-methyl-D-erythritol kinase
LLALFYFMQVELNSPCKVNFILNILGRRTDGFHEVETVMHPVPVYDVLRFEKGGTGIQLSCDNPALPADSSNLVHRAAAQFMEAAKIRGGVKIHLEKRIPLAAGLGGGSGNAATTLTGLNRLFENALPLDNLVEVAATLGSDVPFFLQTGPALATGRGEKVESLAPFQTLNQVSIVLVHPGFGVSTPWAYKNLARFPRDLNGESGRARRLVERLRNSLEEAQQDFYNSLEAPVFEKFPLLVLFRDFFLEHGARIAMMSGSGSTVFALFEEGSKAQSIEERFRSKFGDSCWMCVVPLFSGGSQK